MRRDEMEPRVVKSNDRRIRTVVIRKLLLDEKSRLMRRVHDINRQLQEQK